MDVIYRRREATAREILAELPDAPSYSTVRTLLTLLVKKGHLLSTVRDRALTYRPARQRKAAADSALRRLVRTFFDGSVANAVTGLLSLRDHTLTAGEIARLEEIIAETKKEESP
jgi:BlaI family transcriptional regulator, penicillinase repressor